MKTGEKIIPKEKPVEKDWNRKMADELVVNLKEAKKTLEMLRNFKEQKVEKKEKEIGFILLREIELYEENIRIDSDELERLNNLL